MFKSLREKLKGWVSKNSEEEIVEDKKPKKVDRKEVSKKDAIQKKVERSSKKKEKEAKEKPKKEKLAKPKKEKDAEEIVENKPKKKFGLFKKKEVLDLVEETKDLIKEVEDDVEDFEEEIEEVIEEEKPKKKSLFGGKELIEEKFDEMFEELEMILVTNNVAYGAVDNIRYNLKKRLLGKSLKSVDLTTELRNSIEELLIEPFDFVGRINETLKEKRPFVILFAGINGAGKTTTIAKVVNLLKKNKLSSCVVAADTFRAAAIQQLEEHANKLGVPIIKKDYGTDPAAVGFDGIAYAKKHNIDVVLIDTAGRLQNRDSLMKEIEKVARVTKADLKIFLGESITGNDATEQAKVFNETINIDGIILSKADVDEKGGAAISVASVTGKPILFLGTGQGYDDLEVFDKKKVLEQLGL